MPLWWRCLAQGHWTLLQGKNHFKVIEQGIPILVMLVIRVLREVRQLSYISYGFVMMIRVIVLEVLKESTQLTYLLCFLYGMCKKKQISPNMRWWHWRKLVLSFSKNCNFPTCTCINFVSMMTCSLGKHGKWVHCKHFNITSCNMWCPMG